MKQLGGAISHWWRLCPGRHGVAGASLGILLLFWALRRSTSVMEWGITHLVTPLERGIAKLCSFLPFSVAELVWGLLILCAAAFLGRTGYLLFTTADRWMVWYRAFAGVAAGGLALYAAFCLFWGINYYGVGFEQKSGLTAQPVSAQQLAAATEYFIEGMNRTAPLVPRDDAGCAVLDTRQLLAASDTIYDALSEEYPFLAAPVRRPKPLGVASGLLSAFRFTGFYFPFTGEANINTAFPDALRPAVIAHEMAHQRAIAPEQEANFVGIRAAITSGDPVYEYSGYLQGYIYLGNALLAADPASWQALSPRIGAQANADLVANNAYWSQYETPVSETAQKVYDGFLKSYDQPLGKQSYGACVDLLCAYYFPEAGE